MIHPLHPLLQWNHSFKVLASCVATPGPNSIQPTQSSILHPNAGFLSNPRQGIQIPPAWGIWKKPRTNLAILLFTSMYPVPFPTSYKSAIRQEIEKKQGPNGNGKQNICIFDPINRLKASNCQCFHNPASSQFTTTTIFFILSSTTHPRSTTMHPRTLQF